MRQTACIICKTQGNARVLYEADFGRETNLEESFSARHVFEAGKKANYRTVRCLSCGLVRSDPIFDSEQIIKLYESSEMRYQADSDDIGRTYAHYLRRAMVFTQHHDMLLDIGCGDGFFLEEALKYGFKDAIGVEPSQPVYNAAKPELQKKIICDLFRAELFKPNMFDTVTLFQTVEHIIDPRAAVADIFHVLKPGGVFLAINHNVEALSAKILGRRSPIFEIVHINLFNPQTMSVLLRKHGFEILQTKRVWNSYRLRYWLNYAPLSAGLKRGLQKILKFLRLADIHIPLPAGNMAIIARKPIN